MRTKELRAIWAEIEEVAKAADARSRAAMIDEKLPELWMARYDAEDAVLSDASKDIALNRIADKMRERKPQDVDTHKNGKVTGGLSTTIRALLHPRRDRRTRIAWMGFAASLLLLAVIWYALELPGAPGFKNWMAGGKETKANQIQPMPEVPESPRTVPDRSAPAPDVPKSFENARGLGASPKTTPKKAAPKTLPEVPNVKPSKSEGMLALRIEVGKFTSVMGEPTINYLGERKTYAALPNKPVTTAMRIETGDADKLEFRYNDGSTTALDFNTIVEIPVPDGRSPIIDHLWVLPRPSEIRLVRGKIWTKVVPTAESTKYAVRTPVATAEVLGTEFGLSLKRIGGTLAKPKLRALLQVNAGRVGFFNEFRRVEASANTESTATVGSGPTKPKKWVTLRKHPYSERRKSTFYEIAARLDTANSADRFVHPLGSTGFTVAKLPDGEVRIVHIDEHSPDAKAGLKVGDTVVAMDGRPVHALETMHRVMSLQPGNRFSLTIRRHKQELTLILRAVRSETSQPSLERDLAKRLYAATLPAIVRKTEDSLKALQTLVIETPHAAVFNNLGVVYESKGDMLRAVRNYRDAVRLAPNVSLYRFNFGMALRMVGNFERSVEELEKAVNVDRGLSWSYVDALAYGYSLLDRHNEALAVLEAARRRHSSRHSYWIRTARVLTSSGRFHEARVAAARAIELDPECWVAHHCLGNILSNEGRFVEAEAAFRKALELNPSEARLYDNIGGELAKLGRYEDAVAMFRKAIELDGSSSDSFHLLGNNLMRLGRVKEAEDAYRKAIELDPYDALTRGDLAMLLQRTNRPKEAEGEFLKAILIDPNYALTYSNFGVFLANIGRTDEAETMYKKAIELDPNLSVTYINFGFLLHRAGRIKEAEDLYRQAIELNQTYPLVYNLLGILLRNTDRPQEAEAMYRKAIDLHPNYADAHVNFGLLLKVLGRTAEAEARFRKAIQVDPMCRNAYINLGELLKQLNRPQEVESVYRKAIEVDPNHTDAHVNLAVFLHSAGRLHEAEPFYSRAINLNPKDGGIYVNLGMLLESVGRDEDAENTYRRGVQADPSNRMALNGLAWYLAVRGVKLDEAVVLASRAVGLAPKDPIVCDTLGWVQFRRKAYVEAEVALQKAVELFGADPRAAESWIHLGAVYEATDQRQKAIDAYKSALKLQPQHKVAQEALKRLGGI